MKLKGNALLFLVLKLQISKPSEKFGVKSSSIYLFGLLKSATMYTHATGFLFKSNIKQEKVKDYPWVELKSTQQEGK